MFSAAEDFAIYFNTEGKGCILETIRFTNFDSETVYLFEEEMRQRY